MLLLANRHTGKYVQKCFLIRWITQWCKKRWFYTTIAFSNMCWLNHRAFMHSILETMCSFTLRMYFWKKLCKNNMMWYKCNMKLL
jgi:hypothetical protein